MTFLLTTTPSSSREVILIENLGSNDLGIMLENILITKFHLPKELITRKNIQLGCESRTDAIIHLCLRADGELEIKKMDQYVVKNSLGVFLNQRDGGTK
jgi:hypothetical protein